MIKFAQKIAAGMALVASAGVAHAGLITVSDTTPGVVDRSSATRTLSVGTSGLVSDVDVTVDFSKCSASATTAGCVGEGGSTFNREIVFRLLFGGVTVNLVNEDTFSGQPDSTRVTQTYDDEAASLVGGATLLTGSFRPVGTLGAFDGLDAQGDWTFFFQDTVGADALVLHSISLSITTEDAAGVPSPGTVALLGLGLLALRLRTRS